MIWNRLHTSWDKRIVETNTLYQNVKNYLFATLRGSSTITEWIILHRWSGDLRAFLINLAVSGVAMTVFSIPFTYTTWALQILLYSFFAFFLPLLANFIIHLRSHRGRGIGAVIDTSDREFIPTVHYVFRLHFSTSISKMTCLTSFSVTQNQLFVTITNWHYLCL